MSILSYQAIKQRCCQPSFSELRLIEDFQLDNLKGASYDLTLGDEYCVYNKDLIDKVFPTKFTPTRLWEGEGVVIPPGEVCYLITAEAVNMPRDLSAGISLSFGLIGRGLMLAKQPPIDPGYRGKIACMLHNLSNEEIGLKRGDHILTIEFFELNQATIKDYDGQYNNLSSLTWIIKKPITSGLRQLNEKSNNLIRYIENLIPTIVAIITIIVALLTIFYGYNTYFRNPADTKDIVNSSNNTASVYRQGDEVFVVLQDQEMVVVNLKTNEAHIFRRQD